MASKVFISYRREDSKGEARSIYQTFERAFGRDRVFMDVDNIRKGLDFRKVLHTALADTAVMVVVMGRRWISASDDAGRRRLDDPADFVRIEITNALQRDIPVIPVCVDGARLPTADELPEEMRSLVMRQATSITHEKFARDMEGLLDDIRPLVGSPQKRGGMPWAPIAAGVASLAVLAGGGLWWMTQSRPAAPPAPSLAAAPSASTTSPASNEAALREAAATLLRQQQEERERKEAEVRRRVEEEMSAEARRKLEAARAAAEAAAQRQAEEDAKRRVERARHEAEAEALRKAHAEEERARQDAREKAEAVKIAAAEKARARQAEAQAAWAQAVQTNTMVAYLDYLRAYRDGPNRDEAKARARPLVLTAIEEQIDARFFRSRRADGSIPLYIAYPDNPRAAAACIDWSRSSPQLIQFVAIGSSGQLRGTQIEQIEREALGFCQTNRREGANCGCQIVRRNKENTTQVPEDWIARHID